tara:strand:- start:10976 stop:12139 length:1164 start_codon:yes stop_codon:yes gene_type:complete
MPVFSEANNRIFYACQAVLFEKVSTSTYSTNPTGASYLTGVQSVGINGDLPSVTLPDIGRAQRKFQFYEKQSCEITIERIINQSDALFYQLDPSDYTTSYTGTHILKTLGYQGDGLQHYDITILYTSDKFSHIGIEASGSDVDGNRTHSVTYEQCLITGLSYSFDVSGPITESITLTTRSIRNNSDHTTLSYYSNLPLLATSASQSGAVLKRQDVDISTTAFPAEVTTMFDLSTTAPDGTTILGITSMNIEIGLEYTEISDVGLWRGSDGAVNEQFLYRYINLPVAVTASFTGATRQSFSTSMPNVDDTFSTDRQIRVIVSKRVSGLPMYYVWDLGQKNYLTSINFAGGDVGGGNVEATLTYQNDYSDAVLARDTAVVNIDVPTAPF